MITFLFKSLQFFLDKHFCTTKKITLSKSNVVLRALFNQCIGKWSSIPFSPVPTLRLQRSCLHLGEATYLCPAQKGGMVNLDQEQQNKTLFLDNEPFNLEMLNFRAPPGPESDQRAPCRPGLDLETESNVAVLCPLPLACA